MAVMTAMSGAKKAAILTLLLGEEQASGVLKGLPEDEVERIAREIATLGSVQLTESEQVLSDFHKDMATSKLTARGGAQAVRRVLDCCFRPSRFEDHPGTRPA